MSRNKHFVLTTGLLIGTAVLATPGRAESPGAKAAVPIGVSRSFFPDVPEAAVGAVTERLRGLVEAQTGAPGDFRLVPDATEVARRLADGSLTFGIVYGFEFAWLKDRYADLVPMAVIVPACDRYQACLVVRQGAGCDEWDDLTGKKVALPLRSRGHCRLFLERNCCEGVEVTKPESIEAALDDVVDGVADAAVVEANSLPAFAQRKPGRAVKLKVLLRSEDFPLAAVVYREGGPDAGTVERFRRAMLSIHDSPHGRWVLRLCRIQHFAPVPERYADQLAAIRKAYPPPEEAPRPAGGGE